MEAAHATAAELTAFLMSGAAPDPLDADRLLTQASALIDYHVFASYEVDTATGLAADATLAAVLRDATCAQVEQWVEVGEANDIDGLAEHTAGVAGYSGDRAPELAPRAHRLLANANLLRINSYRPEVLLP